MKDLVTIAFITVAILAMSAIVFGTTKIYENSNNGNGIASKINCNFIGLVHARNNLGYFECGDSIIIKRLN